MLYEDITSKAMLMSRKLCVESRPSWSKYYQYCLNTADGMAIALAREIIKQETAEIEEEEVSQV